MPDNIDRPLPRLATARGLPAYDPREVQAYRLALGVTPEELASRLKTSRPYISRNEAGRFGPLEARIGDRLLGGVESIARRRVALREEGMAVLEEIRGSSKAAKR